MAEPARRVRDEIPAPKVLQWEQFKLLFAKNFRVGEQVAAVGPNGSGKSVAILELAQIQGSRMAKDKRPARVVVLATKPRDETLSGLGWPIIKKWPPAYGEEHCIVWPRGGPVSDRKKLQRAVFKPLLNQIEHEGNQTVVVDEEADFERPLPAGLGLQSTMQAYWQDTRSSKIQIMATTQRPRWVTVSMWSEPAWLLIFRLEYLEDLRHVAGFSGNKEAVLQIVPRLGGHEFLCVRRQRAGEHDLYVSRVER